MIAIMGESFFVNRVIRELQKKGIEASYVELRSSKTALRKTLKSHKIIHFIGSPTVSMDFIKLILFKIWGKKIIVSWIGFDMRKARQILSRKIISKLCQPFISVNLAADDHTIKNLNALGIKAKLLPPPFYHLFQLRELPKDDKIAVYLPDMPQTLWDFYHGDWIKRLVNELPNVEFIIFQTSEANSIFLLTITGSKRRSLSIAFLGTIGSTTPYSLLVSSLLISYFLLQLVS